MLAIVLLGRGGYGRIPHDQLTSLETAVSKKLTIDDATMTMVAFVEQGAPSLPDALQACADKGATRITVLPVFVPGNENLHRWLAKVMMRWHSSWDGQSLVLQLLPSLGDSKALEEAVTAVLPQLLAETDNLLEDPPAKWEHDPKGWSRIPPHRYHLLMCRGPRCTAKGASDMWQYLRQRLREEGLVERANGAMMVSTSCLYPCHHAPVLVVHPDDVWYSVPTTAAVDKIVKQHLQNGRFVKEYIIQT
ncbi:MAG: hypothetical protein CSA11_10075 [Chloroflexi bacterium]|nr:MAG: hypothetical protein CSA11_10075 [Chloroflexota bacterium]